MDANTLESFREALRRRRETVWHEVTESEELLEDISAERESERQERAQETRDARILDRLDERGKREIETIDAALQRIEDGGYGSCLECGIEIPIKRLRALPEAELCVDCAAAAEHASADEGEESVTPQTPPPTTPPEDISRLSDDEAKTLILEHLARDDRIDADELEIQCCSGVVNLAGTLPSEAQRDMVVELISDILGFFDVVDHVSITPVPWERDDDARTAASAPVPDDVEQARMGEPVETEDVVESDEEGTGYAPPDMPPRRERP